MRKRVWVGAAIAVLAANTAQAQVQTGPGFFGYIDGMYVLPTDTNRSSFLLGNRAGQGWSVDGRIGYRFDGPWDIALGGRFFDQSRGKNRFSGISNRGDGTYWNLDGDVGYTLSGPGWGVRPFLGVRYQHWRMTVQKLSTVVGHNSVYGESWGVGPRLGVDAAINLSGPISLFGGIDTSFLYGRVTDTVKNTPGRAGGGNFPNARERNARTYSRLIWDIGALLGVDVEVAPQVHVAIGYKVEWFDGLQSRDFGRGRAGELIHGPFLRLAYNWGAPSVGDPPPLAPTVGLQNFIAFFDFDRADLTAPAVQTIKQAAALAKTGRFTQINVTGHADRAGGDAYNMALSLRRANAVKGQLMREGIAANQIAVVGRGESQPLVPTADGVRDPQNRRVEIVIN